MQKIKNGKPTCPRCGTRLDGWSTKEPVPGPSDGDISICLYCQSINRFRVKDGHYSIEAATEEKLEELRADPTLWAEIQSAIRASLKIMSLRMERFN